jgi:hypothetical protein
MTCVKGAIDDIYFVKWLAPEAADVDEILKDVEQRREQRGNPLRYIAIIGAELPPPSEEVRSAMRRNIDDLLRHCVSVHLVIEGKGFRRAMSRSIGTSIFLLSKNRGRAFAHDSVEQALERMGLDSSRANAVLQEARTRDLLNATVA